VACRGVHVARIASCERQYGNYPQCRP
jgi:hypothetical protein